MAEALDPINAEIIPQTPITAFVVTDEVWRRPKVESVTGLACSTIYLQMKNGTFPKPIKIGERAVGWRMSEVNAWLEQRTADREDV